MLNVGLTGGIACGKSTVARMLMEKGAFLIDADALAHAVEAPDKPAWHEIVRHFGRGILRADRTINRRKLGAIVFANPAELEVLNRIVHPAVQQERLARIAAIRAEHPEAIILSDVPLLIETGMTDQFDLILLVYLPREGQIARLMARNGFSREEAEKRLASQMPIDAKLPYADIVVNNEGTPEETQRRVEAVWEELEEKEQSSPHLFS
ncbi:MAG: dephospho-CoA kinase [Deltaproteobacteria bacterium]|nr:dephospho-CoA kinase [Deltaproteobacteria bacterium]